MYISATELKNNLGKYLDLASTEDIFITKNGKVISKLSSPSMNNDADTALLSNVGNITSFRFSGHNIRFLTSDKLEYYEDVKEWDNGYLVVTAKYKNSPSVEEEYIDLIPILENLNFEPSEFLKPIEKVRVYYE